MVLSTGLNWSRTEVASVFDKKKTQINKIKEKKA